MRCGGGIGIILKTGITAGFKAKAIMIEGEKFSQKR
jgi:hypothetical protein